MRNKAIFHVTEFDNMKKRMNTIVTEKLMVIKWIKRILALVLAYFVWKELGVMWALVYFVSALILSFVALLAIDQVAKMAFSGDGRELSDYMRGIRDDAPSLVVFLEMVVGPVSSLVIPFLMVVPFLGWDFYGDIINKL